MQVYNSSMAKPYLGILKKIEVLWNKPLIDHLFMLVGAWLNFLFAYTSPTVCTNLILMHIGENVSFITTSIDVKLVEIANKGMICSW